jgi:uncharacterized membrane-anchored protein
MKIGHYMHVPPKAVFFSQVFGSFLGIPINYAVVRWVLDTKFDYITGAKEDPAHQWTGQSLATNLTMGVQYVLIVSTESTCNVGTTNIAHRAPVVSLQCTYTATYHTAFWLAQLPRSSCLS